LVILVCIKLSHEVRLRCKYCNYKSNDTDFEETCDLVNKEEILPEMDGQKFEFSGVTTDQKIAVKTLAFRTSNISFVPMEAFSTFPNLERIVMLNTSLGRLEYNWLNHFLKYEKNIKYIDFRWNKINISDPQVLDIFSRFKRVNLKWNLCVDKKFTIINGDTTNMKKDLDHCFHYFYNTDTFYTAGKLALETKKLAEKNNNDIQILRKEIEDLRKAVHDLINVCYYDPHFVSSNGRP
jgi:hypothetical protein